MLMILGLEQIKMKSTAIDKYSYLSNLRNTNVNLFYRLLIDNMKVCWNLIVACFQPNNCRN